MAYDKTQNFAVSTLNGGIDDSQGDLDVNADNFPAVDFNVVIWKKSAYAEPQDDPNMEIVRVTNKGGGTDWTITRGQEGTAGKAHENGDRVELNITAKVIQDLIDGKTEAAGLSGGQTLIGGTDNGDDLTLQSTSHGTKGYVYFGAAQTSYFDEVNENLIITGDIGLTGTRVTKGWFTDLQVTNAIAGSITGNAATVSTITGLAPDTATTQATQAAITTCANLVTVGALNSGSITSGFGNIDIGSSTLDCGIITAASNSTIGNLTLADGSITDSGGSIDFGNEDITMGNSLTVTESFGSHQWENFGTYNIIRVTDNLSGPAIQIKKARGTIGGSEAVVADNDELGYINWLGHDGTNYENAAYIGVFVDGTPAEEGTDMPARMVFATTPDGSDAPLEALRLDSSQNATFAGDVIANSHGLLEGDATGGRVLRRITLKIDNGTNVNTLKCTVSNLWNGDTIAETDNIAKGATTGNFTLDAGGERLDIEAAGLAGNVIVAWGACYLNASGAVLDWSVSENSNDIRVVPRVSSTAALQDLTTLVDTGIMTLQIVYITDA